MAKTKKAKGSAAPGKLPSVVAAQPGVGKGPGDATKEDVTKGEVVRYSLNTKCDGNWVVVAKTNGQPEKLSWPKNIGDCPLELACRDANLNLIGNSRMTLAKNSTVKSYQSGAGVVDIVFGCAVGSFDAKCILELDR